MPLSQGKPKLAYLNDSSDVFSASDRAQTLWSGERTCVERSRKQLLQMIVALQRENTALRGQLRIDPMTGLFNRLAMFEELERQWERWVRHGHVASLLFIDLNDFKSINDTYGHAAGDCALVSMARHLRHQVRSSEWVARIGGDEFAVLLPDSDTQEAQRVAAKLRADELTFPLPKELSKTTSQVTLRYAIGVSTLGLHLSSVRNWIDAADGRMYEHKCSTARRTI